MSADDNKSIKMYPACKEFRHVGKITLDRRNKNVNTIDNCRSKIVRNRVFDCQMAMENTVSSDFDPGPSKVKNVFDCCLSGVKILFLLHYINKNSVVVTS